MKNFERYDITDYLKDDKELQKAIIEELLKENAELKAENELLREENLEEQKQYTEVVLANAQKIRQLKQTLQEIKKYLNGHKIADEVRIKCVLDLITKAEEE